MTYPLPSYALSIWLVGDQIHIGIPPLDEHDRGHTVRIPLANCQPLKTRSCNTALSAQKTCFQSTVSDDGNIPASQRGILALIDMLKERERVGRREPIGTRASPSQHDINLILKALEEGRARKVGKKAEFNDSLTLEDLEI